jgi:hypothetical protein
MTQVTVRPAHKEDITTFAGELKAPTLRGWVGEVDGKVMALGGLAIVGGRHIAFLDVTDEGRNLLKSSLHVRKALIRTARMVMEDARNRGVRFAFAEAEMKYQLADKMLEHLGFKPDPRAPDLYRWKP